MTQRFIRSTVWLDHYLLNQTHPCGRELEGHYHYANSFDPQDPLFWHINSVGLGYKPQEHVEVHPQEVYTYSMEYPTYQDRTLHGGMC